MVYVQRFVRVRRGFFYFSKKLKEGVSSTDSCAPEILVLSMIMDLTVL